MKVIELETKQGNRRYQTSPRFCPWWVTWTIRPVCHRRCMADYGQTWRHSQNRKYITYCVVVRGGPSHGHK